MPTKATAFKNAVESLHTAVGTGTYDTTSCTGTGVARADYLKALTNRFNSAVQVEIETMEKLAGDLHAAAQTGKSSASNGTNYATPLESFKT